MGNSCTTGEEDIGMNKMAMRAVGGNTNEITDELLDASMQHNSLKQRVALNIELTDLPNMDVGSLTDAFCLVFEIKG